MPRYYLYDHCEDPVRDWALVLLVCTHMKSEDYLSDSLVGFITEIRDDAKISESDLETKPSRSAYRNSPQPHVTL